MLVVHSPYWPHNIHGALAGNADGGGGGRAGRLVALAEEGARAGGGGSAQAAGQHVLDYLYIVAGKLLHLSSGELAGSDSAEWKRSHAGASCYARMTISASY